MKYKVGDRVRIKSLDWYNENKDKYGTIYTSNGFCFCDDMTKHCGDIMKIIDIIVDPKDSNQGYYIMDNVKKWTDEMIECKVGEETKPNIIEEAKTYWDSIKDAWICPEGYIFKDEHGNVINATKIVLEKKPDDKLKLESTKKVREYWSEYTRIYIEIYEDEPNECVLTHLYTLEGHRQKGYGRKALIEAESIAKELGCHTTYLKVETDSWMHQWYLRMGYKWYKNANKEYTWLVKNLTSIEKKKKEYPKTYEECHDMLDDTNKISVFVICKFAQLLEARNAYWKIAGEEMGLGKPWEPDWTNYNEYKFVIGVNENKIIKCYNTIAQFVLAFPTEEMRDAFYENFKELIEQCKELL